LIGSLQGQANSSGVFLVSRFHFVLRFILSQAINPLHHKKRPLRAFLIEAAGRLISHGDDVLLQSYPAGQIRTASCLGFGPRFLHSTGQAYKGGPNTGVFLQITADANEDLQVPGRGYTFGIVEAAQAQGDIDVLAERGRRVLRVHLGDEVAAGLEQLNRLLA
jgi:hypothetical protein